ncbi:MULTISPECIES: ABC transporter permease [Actinomycetes]|uniref:FtsX-like permease family protein n=1 Tax=Microbacterium profundi TaxID=450380 RepID=A0ABV3LKE9_9MICO|nr:FtsX-like permease family protein [Microbacterium profundi]
MNAGIIREAAASARSQPVASVVTVLMIVGMILAVMLTTGRTVGAEQQVLGSIDSVGTRSITVRADSTAGITTDVLDRIAHIEGIEWAAAFSAAVDATNAALSDGTRVPVRYLYTTQLDPLGISGTSALPGELAWASPMAQDRLGLPETAGGIALTNGASYAVTGSLDVPDFLARFEPAVFIPQPDAAGTEPVNILVVIAETPELVAPVSEAVSSVLAPEDSSKVTIDTSETLAQLRGLIQDQLGSFSRGLVLALLGLTGGLVAILLYGLVMMRRKDFGRRRALGATRSLIVTLLLAQTAILAVIGITIGTAASTIILRISGDPLPGLAFMGALGILTLATAMIAAAIPAIIASRREPIRELRVP